MTNKTMTDKARARMYFKRWKAGESIDVTGIYECRECGYRISPIQLGQCGYPFDCPRCGLQNIYQYMYVPGVSAA